MRRKLVEDARRPPHTFVALDLETADDGRDSACALALVRVENLEIVQKQVCLIKPPRRYFRFTYLHGIRWEDVQDKPTFGECWPALTAMLEGIEFLAAHNAPFDRSVLQTCCAVAGLRPPVQQFVCTMQVARKTWGVRPTKLPDVCRFLGIPLRHHQAGSDAEACARILIAAEQARQPVEASGKAPL